MSESDYFLETERLLLRQFTDADVDNLFELDSDPAVMRFLNGGEPTPRAVIEREILPRFLRSYAWNDGYGYWAAIERTTGDFLGWFGFHPAEGANADAHEIALGYRLRRAAWGKGYATEGARALLRKGFDELGARRVIATTYQDNLASRRVMEKVGMRLVRTYRITPDELAAAGTFYITVPAIWDGDDVEYALEKAEWDQQFGALGQQGAQDGGIEAPALQVSQIEPGKAGLGAIGLRSDAWHGAGGERTLEYELDLMHSGVVLGELMVTANILAHETEIADDDRDVDFLQALAFQRFDERFTGMLAAARQDVPVARGVAVLDGEQLALLDNDRFG
jgi:RimJ/RimL family protein N-acetyltransferase